MNLKLKNGLIKAFSYLLAVSGTVVVLVFQYFTEKNPSPISIKVAIPCMLALLVFFLIYYKSIKAKINRKLIAIETAKELGNRGRTSSIVANLLETIGIVIPMALIAGIFMIGGEFLVTTGLIMFEVLGFFSLVIIGNIICDFNTKQELKRKEAEQAEFLADNIAKKIGELPTTFE